MAALPPAVSIPLARPGRVAPVPSAAEPTRPGPRVVAVVVTRDRPALLRRCLAAVAGQTRPPDETLVVDNDSPGPETGAAVAAFPGVRHLRMPANLGGAGGFHIGAETALRAGADLVWLMDDDGRPQDPHCLQRLLAGAEPNGIVAPLVLDAEAPERLAFPIRLRGRTRFHAAEVAGHPRIGGFANLFNGALVGAGLFRAVGLPEPRFFIRGDEVEFLYRALRAGLPVRIETAARFLHPSSRPELRPIMFGLFYAVDPATDAKRRHLFRNRGHIFRAYGMWGYLAGDVARYGWYYLVSRRLDLGGFGRWLGATAAGLRGDFLRGGAPGKASCGPEPPASPRDRDVL